MLMRLDFTWGDTRKIAGEVKQGDHSDRHGEYEIGSVQLKLYPTIRFFV